MKPSFLAILVAATLTTAGPRPGRVAKVDRSDACGRFPAFGGAL